MYLSRSVDDTFTLVPQLAVIHIITYKPASQQIHQQCSCRHISRSHTGSSRTMARVLTDPQGTSGTSLTLCSPDVCTERSSSRALDDITNHVHESLKLHSNHGISTEQGAGGRSASAARAEGEFPCAYGAPMRTQGDTDISVSEDNYADQGLVSRMTMAHPPSGALHGACARVWCVCRLDTRGRTRHQTVSNIRPRIVAADSDGDGCTSCLVSHTSGLCNL